MDSGTMAKICSRISPVRAQLSTPACIPGPVSTEHWVLSLTAPQLLASPGFWSFSLQHYGQRKRLTNFCSLLPLLPLVYGRSIWVMDPRPCPHDPNIRKDEQSSILNFKLLWGKGYPSSFPQTRKAGSDGGKLKTMSDFDCNLSFSSMICQDLRLQQRRNLGWWYKFGITNI